MEHLTKILVVDDEPNICANVEKILTKNNYDVTRALSAKEALEKMAQGNFSLLISDIVMPETNGLQLLKLVKKQAPLTKVMMMTAYASTDTAVKAIRLGALDYIPKPFTPDELRHKVAQALSGELKESNVTDREKRAIERIDVDIPFDRGEVAKYAGEAYADMLGPSDMPVVEMPAPGAVENYCMVGEMVCEIHKKLGTTCKAGLKTTACPQKKAKKGKSEKKGKTVETRRLIGVDLPFDYEEVAAVTGPEYVRTLHHEGVSFVPYEELKRNMAPTVRKGTIDVDIPFDRGEVAKYAGEAYADMLGPSDMPVVEMPAPGAVENYCMVGEMVCEIHKKLGNTCKAGLKTAECPQKKAKKGKAEKKGKAVETRRLIGVDLPFDYEEVAAVTGPEYVRNLHHEGISFLPYEELKKNAARLAVKVPRSRDVLVVDDEVAVNNNIRKILSKKGFQVEQAVTKTEALEKIEKKPYGIVLLDLRMPGVNGLELLKAVREKRPESMVVIITGYASIETAVETTRLGAVDYVAKPFTPDEIRDAAEKAFLLAA